MKKSIVVVDDHVSVRDMLVWILMREAAYEVIGQAGSGIEAMKICGVRNPDLLILDLVLPYISGIEVLRRIRKDLPRTRVLIYSGTSDPVMMKEALRERPHGYVEKLQGLKILRDAISTIAGGGTYFSTETAQALYETSASRADGLNLSAREREILQMVAEGRSSKEISGVLNVALKTVENHRANLMLKLDRHDVASLTRYAVRAGMVGVE